jgi:hypothetical protein
MALGLKVKIVVPREQNPSRTSMIVTQYDCLALWIDGPTTLLTGFIGHSVMHSNARAIRIGVAIALFCIASGAFSADDEAQKQNDWIAIFNGKDLTGWVAEGASKFTDQEDRIKPVWSVQNGLLRCDGKGFGFLRFDTEVEDFIFHVEFRMGKDCNSGIGIRHLKYDMAKSTATRPSYSGYEIQLLDDSGKEASKTSTASLYRYVAPTANTVKPAGEWNSIDIECIGPKINVTLNGQLIQNVDQSQIEEIKNKPLKGYVSVQNHGKQIEFRNLKLRKIKN